MRGFFNANARFPACSRQAFVWVIYLDRKKLTLLNLRFRVPAAFISPAGASVPLVPLNKLKLFIYSYYMFYSLLIVFPFFLLGLAVSSGTLALAGDST